MDIEITQMTLKDLEELKDCLLEEFDDFWSFSMLQQELENNQNLNSHYFVAKMQNEIVRLLWRYNYLSRSKYDEHCRPKKQTRFRYWLLPTKIYYRFF